MAFQPENRYNRRKPTSQGGRGVKFVFRVLVLLVICLFIGYNTDLFFETSVEKNEAQDKIEQTNLSSEAKKNE